MRAFGCRQKLANSLNCGTNADLDIALAFCPFRNANLSRYDMAGEVWDEHETARFHWPCQWSGGHVAGDGPRPAE